MRTVATTSSRALTLLSLLSSGREWTSTELADRLEVSDRTIRRDLDALRQLGYPVDAAKGPDGGYRLGAGATLPPLLFDDDQAVAVALALQTAPVTVFGLRDAAARSLQTLKQVMPSRLRRQIDALALTSIRNFWEFSAPPIASGTLHAVGDAVRQSHLLRLEILRADGSRANPGDADFRPPCNLQPHHLALWAGRWYLVARDPTDDSWPVLRVDRIHAHAPTGLAFTRQLLPGGDVAEHVVTAYDRGDTPAEWQCLGSAVIAYPAEVVARWAPGGSVVEPVTAATARLTLGAWSWAGIAGILATFDAELTEVQPPELCSALAQLSRRLRRFDAP